MQGDFFNNCYKFKTKLCHLDVQVEIRQQVCTKHGNTCNWHTEKVPTGAKRGKMQPVPTALKYVSGANRGAAKRGKI